MSKSSPLEWIRQMRKDNALTYKHSEMPESECWVKGYAERTVIDRPSFGEVWAEARLMSAAFRRGRVWVRPSDGSRLGVEWMPEAESMPVPDCGGRVLETVDVRRGLEPPVIDPMSGLPDGVRRCREEWESAERLEGKRELGYVAKLLLGLQESVSGKRRVRPIVLR